jgi:hypothetical protein
MRREELISIIEGRDAGKTFMIREMSATKAEKWAARALLALLKSGVNLSDAAVRQGMMGVAAVGMSAFAGIPWELAEPLLDDMIPCFRYVMDPNSNNPILKDRAITEDDIEDITTRFQLRKVWVDLHFGFLLAAKSSKSEALAASTGISSSTTPTFPQA